MFVTNLLAVAHNGHCILLLQIKELLEDMKASKDEEYISGM